ncbi:MAG: SHOCT domain-containing protein [Desulfotignum sp.]
MKNKFFTFFISVIPMVLIPFFFGCTHKPMDRSMGGWGHMMGYGGSGGIFMWILLIIIIAVIFYFVINRGKTTGSLTGTEKESPSETLKKRYAKGEITKEEFDKLKKDIES